MENNNYNRISNLFLRQSYLDAWDDYLRSIQKNSFIKWDYVVLTASNEEQAQSYRMQIARRVERGLIPASTQYVVLPDPQGKRVGSGGATLNVLRYLAEADRSKSEGGSQRNPFVKKRILVIHSGGDSKRVPQYSSLGKLFSPVPRLLPDGRGSTLFDEFIIGMSGVPSRISEGMLVMSGDVLLLFNPLQIDAQFSGAAAISIKEPVSTGKNHGVFLNDGEGNVMKFLHKQSEENLRRMGAVNDHDKVDLDTGAILLSADLMNALYGLISTDGVTDADKFSAFVNERARISFYGDFLYPLAKASSLEQYYREKPEGDYTPELRECRSKIWEAISPFSLKLLCLSPAKFIHFGTTRELLRLMVDEISDYEFLDWKAKVLSKTGEGEEYASYLSYVGKETQVAPNAYLECSFILGESRIGEGSIISHLRLQNVTVPDGVVIHGLPLTGGRFVVRIYGVTDNPKDSFSEGVSFLQSSLEEFVQTYQIDPRKLWKEGTSRDLWNASLYPVCDSMEEAAAWAMRLYRMVCEGDAACFEEWLSVERTSLCESFGNADMDKVISWQNELENCIICRKLVDKLSQGQYYKEALEVLGQRRLTEEIYHMLMKEAEEADFSLKIRIYYAVSRLMKESGLRFGEYSYDVPESLCFKAIQKAIYDTSIKRIEGSLQNRIRKERVDVSLPVRVNWGGGWTDTPPHCNENGGVVINAAISLNGILPVQITVRRLPEYYVEFESQDVGVHGIVRDIKEIQECNNPFDPFALHKAALIACGVVPLVKKEDTLQELLERLGGGIYLSTQVVGIPKGSGLGTSSILAGACVKGIFAFLGMDKPEEDIYSTVLCMEQIMSTGGGWQDQVGGLTDGIKLITTDPGMVQNIKVTKVNVPQEALDELQERFALIYTGQRRLARNLLREVMGNYIGARPQSLVALSEMKSVAFSMTRCLEQGDIDGFAELLNQQWELSKKLDMGSTNTCIEQIFLACEDLIDARFIAGAGGGGFLMVILKKGISKELLRERLTAIFQDSGVDVWDSRFV